MSSRSLRPSGRKIGAAVLSATLGLAGLGLAASPVAADEINTVTDDCGRLAGADRFGTAAAIADAYDAQSPVDHVIIANGFNFPDALAASGLARELDAPVLLINGGSEEIPDGTKVALNQLDPANVTIVGGTAAVPQAIEDTLDDTYVVDRVAGDDRYETARDIALEITEVGQIDGANTAIIATGNNYPDALAGGPVAYHGDGTNPFPILLTNGATIPAATQEALDAHNIEQVIVLGGTDAVPASVVTQLATETGNAPIVLAGTTREGTAQEVAEFAVTEQGFAPEAVLLADGREIFPSPDALSGGPLGGLEMAPILLVNPGMPAQTEAFITENADAITQVIALGGTVAVPTEVLNAGCEAGGVPIPGQNAAAFDAASAEGGDVLTGTLTGDFATAEIAGACIEGTPVIVDAADDTDATADGVQFSVNIAQDAAAGDCEITITFFDADGNEIGTDTATIAITAPATNQAFVVTPAEAMTVETGDEVDFTVADITTDVVDVALFECADVTIDADGNVVFADANNDDVADRAAADTEAVITQVNGVVGSYGDYVNNVTVTDGSITFTVDTVSDECVVAVVFNDADNDNALDLDANNMPTELFAIGSEVTAATIAALDAEPEFAVNRFGENHTVTASLVDVEGNTVAVDGDQVRFTLMLADNTDDDINAITVTDGEVATCTGTAVDIATVTVTDGTAEYTFTQQDPNATVDSNDFEYCVEAEVLNRDFNADTTDTTDTIDFVGKVFSDDAAAAAALNLEPEQDTNLVGTQHTVTATIVDQFGDPVDQTVRFEVYREGQAATSTNTADPIFSTNQPTGADGVASFTYTGPTEDADDVIIACVIGETEGDTTCDAAITATETGLSTGVFVLNTADAPANDNTADAVEKFWVEQAVQGEYPENEVLGFDTAADFVDGETAADVTVTNADGTTTVIPAGSNLRFAYDTGDQFFIVAEDGTTVVAVSPQQFETALDEGDLVEITYNPGGVSQFTLINVA